MVGDDAQAIYSFRAAAVRNILGFPGHFDPPATDRHAGAELSLDPADPDAANAVIGLAAEGFTKNL